jgi:hypothetical protein
MLGVLRARGGCEINEVRLQTLEIRPPVQAPLKNALERTLFDSGRESCFSSLEAYDDAPPVKTGLVEDRKWIALCRYWDEIFSIGGIDRDGILSSSNIAQGLTGLLQKDDIPLPEGTAFPTPKIDQLVVQDSLECPANACLQGEPGAGLRLRDTAHHPDNGHDRRPAE